MGTASGQSGMANLKKVRFPCIAVHAAARCYQDPLTLVIKALGRPDLPDCGPEVIASLVSYLVKPEAYFITGRSNTYLATANASLYYCQSQARLSRRTGVSYCLELAGLLSSSFAVTIYIDIY